jgi:hypothetical protein
MPLLSQPEQLHQFFTRLGERYLHPATIYLFGGSALVWLGGGRPTVDLDVSLAAPNAQLRRAVAEAAAEAGLDVEESSPSGFMPLPSGYEGRHRLLGQFGQVAVYVFDPYSIAVMKLDRAFESDLEDVRFLLAAGHIDLETLARCLDDVARRYDEPLKLRRQFDEFRRTL